MTTNVDGGQEESSVLARVGSNSSSSIGRRVGSICLGEWSELSCLRLCNESALEVVLVEHFAHSSPAVKATGMDRRIDVSGDLKGSLLYLRWCWGSQNVCRQKSNEEDDAESCHDGRMLTGSREKKKVNGLWNRVGRREGRVKEKLSLKEESDFSIICCKHLKVCKLVKSKKNVEQRRKIGARFRCKASLCVMIVSVFTL